MEVEDPSIFIDNAGLLAYAKRLEGLLCVYVREGNCGLLVGFFFI